MQKRAKSFMRKLDFLRCRHQSKIRRRRQERKFGVLSRGYEDKKC